MARPDPAPLIGITMYGPDEEAPLPRHSLPTCYSTAVAMAGGIPLLLPALEAVPAGMLDRLDGLVLSGGGDIDPDSHTGGSHPEVYLVNPVRDRFELDLARSALARADLPVLGICRGMQVMNVARGGDLELHLPDTRGDAVSHRAPPRLPVRHPITIEAASPLEAIFGTRELEVCSWHHQEIRKLGSGLVANARAGDGVIEGIHATDHPFAVGVQWHPEMQLPDEPVQLRIFTALVERARRAR